MFYNGISLIVFISGLLVGAQGLLLLLKGKEKSARYFAITLLIAMLWAIDIVISIFARTHALSEITARVGHFMAIPILLSFIQFSVYYATGKSVRYYHLIFILVCSLYAYVLFCTKTIILQTVFQPEIDMWVWVFGDYFMIYLATFIGAMLIGIKNLYTAYRQSTDIVRKKSSLGLLISLILGFLPPTIVSILLPMMGVYSLNWMGPASFIIWVIITNYVIYKYTLFSIKLIIIEITMFLLWITIFIHSILDTPLSELITELVLLVIIMILSILLTNSLKKLEKTRDKVRTLEQEIKTLCETIENTF